MYNVLVMNNQLKLGKHKFFPKKNRRRKKRIPLRERSVFYRLVRLFFKRHIDFIKGGFALSLFVTYLIALCIALFGDTEQDREMRKPNQDYYKNLKNNLDNQSNPCYYIHRTL